MTLADWVRGVLLHSLEGPGEAQMEMHIFTELVGIQMLLMNTLEPLLRGDKIVPGTARHLCFGKSKPPRPRRRRNSSPSAARTGRSSHANRPTLGPQ